MKSPNVIDLSTILAPYRGKWVALSKDEKTVLGSGDSIDEALAEARSKGENQPIITKSPDSFTAYLW